MKKKLSTVSRLPKSGIFPVPLPSILSEASTKSPKSRPPSICGQVFVLGAAHRSELPDLLKEHALPWQLPSLLEQAPRELIHFTGMQGPVWIFCRQTIKGNISHHGLLEDSVYAWHREQVGAVLSFAKAYHLQQLQVQFLQCNDEQALLGALVGFELAFYTYKNWLQIPKSSLQLQISVDGKSLDPALKKQAQGLGQAINVARHLVNAPPNLLNPQTCAQAVTSLLKGKKGISVQVWNEARLRQEKMGLHLAVGQGAETPPCLVHIRYRPRGLSKQPVAFVGKGITFDSGGLDIKPSQGMRLMKKDMGGSATLVGLAVWIAEAQPAVPVDIYLALAENSVDSKSMRPSDVVIARNGTSVEIHNTDAEGRLVLADALDVAVTQKKSDEPAVVIDVATLTGAIKAGLGAEIAGVFCNDDSLAGQLLECGFAAGEPAWRMPLYSKYGRGMDSAFADIVNCVDGFGGAITAALFLEKFTRQKPWAHFDIYAWSDRPQGPLSFAGGNGQTVQTLIQFLLLRESMSSNH